MGLGSFWVWQEKRVNQLVGLREKRKVGISVCCTMLAAFKSDFLIFTILRGQCCYLHVIDKEAEAQRGEVIWPRFYGLSMEM